MELMQMIRIVLRRWWLVLIPVVIAGVWVAPDLLNRNVAAGGFSTLIRYSAAQEYDALPPRDGDLQDLWLASELTVNALTAWVQTESFRREVVTQTAAQGLQIDANALGIAADNERSIGQLILAWPNSDELSVIANAAIAVLQNRSVDYFPQMGSTAPDVTILDAPQIVAAPPPLTNRFAPLIRIALGLLAGLGLTFLAHYLDPTLRRREDIETLGLPVLANLPKD